MTDKSERFSQILSLVRSSELNGKELRQFAMVQLDDLDTYDWSGVYRLEGEMLVLDAYVGAETDHTEIPVGKGVCGTAAAEKSNQVIADVREIRNYLSCSLNTRSEIVTLIHQGDDILGQIDIDGHLVGAFDSDDEKFLDELGSILASKWAD